MNRISFSGRLALVILLLVSGCTSQSDGAGGAMFPVDLRLFEGGPALSSSGPTSLPPRLVVRRQAGAMTASNLAVPPGLTVVRTLSMNGRDYTVLKVPGGAGVSSATVRLRGLPGVEMVEVDGVVSASSLRPNDRYFIYQGHYQDSPMGSLEPLKTRIQAFAEMVRGKG